MITIDLLIHSTKIVSNNLKLILECRLQNIGEIQNVMRKTKGHEILSGTSYQFLE